MNNLYVVVTDLLAVTIYLLHSFINILLNHVKNVNLASLNKDNIEECLPQVQLN